MTGDEGEEELRSMRDALTSDRKAAYLQHRHDDPAEVQTPEQRAEICKRMRAASLPARMAELLDGEDGNQDSEETS